MLGRPTTRTTRSGCSAKLKSGGWTRTSRLSTCSFPPRRSVCSRWSRRRTFVAQFGRAGGGGGSHLRAARRAASHLQRLFDRWRRDRAAGVRQLRRPGRLRNAGSAGRLGQRRYRDRALRWQSWRGIKPKVAAEHGAIGCLIYSDPARRRLLRRRRLSQRPYPPQGRRAARQRDGHAGLSRRSADARRGRDPGRQAAAARPRPRHSPRYR